MKIILLGFMGSGKSSVARELSASLAWPVIELDEEIVKRSGCKSIPEIFEVKGESFFRELETHTLREVLSTQRGDYILSPGGGTFAQANNQEIFYNQRNSTDWMVYLQTPLASVYERIGHSEERPLFRNGREWIERLYEERLKGYNALSTLIVPTQFFSASEIAWIVMSTLGLSSGAQIEDAKLPLVWSVIGDPIHHSRSPEVHNSALQKFEIKTSSIHDRKRAFVATRVHEIGHFMDHFRRVSTLRGLAVTLPYKEEVCAYLDDIDLPARTLGAVNTVVKEGDRLIGYNTDWLGLQNPLLARGSLKGKSVAILGAGGTARAAVYAMQSVGAVVTVINRSYERMRSLQEDFGVEGKELATVKDLHDFDVVIQTTAVGLSSQESLFQAKAFKEGTLVMDVVYTPPVTAFLQQARAAGCLCITGEEMFLAQASAQFELFQGVAQELRFELSR